MVTIKKGKVKKARTAKRPMLVPKKQKKMKLLKKDEIALQKQIAEEGLNERAEVPKGNISLKKEDAEVFRKKNKSFKKKTMSRGKGKTKKPGKGRAAQSENKKGRKNSFPSNPGLICITNLPHGFYERQLEGYFSQFGDLSRVRLVRSKLTGRSCGYAYIEFAYAEVAKIAAKAMNNYLTFGKIMKCLFMPYNENLADSIFSKEGFGPRNCPKVNARTNAILELNQQRTEEQVKKREVRVRSNFSRKLRQLEKLGVKMHTKLVDADGKTMPYVKRERKPRKVADATEKKMLPPVVLEIEEMKAKTRKKSDVSLGKSKESPDVNTKSLATQNTEVSDDLVPEKDLSSDVHNTNVKGVSNVKMAQKRKSLEPQTAKIPEQGKITPKMKKLKAADTAAPESTGKSQNKCTKSLNSNEGNAVGDKTLNVKERGVVFEADESDDEITFKTPPFAQKKLVKITPTSPVGRITDLPKVNAGSVQKAPKGSQKLASAEKGKKADLPKTPVAKRKILQNKRKSLQGSSIKKPSKREKRRSLS